MNERTKSLLIGVALGAVIGAVFGWLVGDSDDPKSRALGEPTGLAAMNSGDFVKIGISILTLARELNSMMKRA